MSESLRVTRQIDGWPHVPCTLDRADSGSGRDGLHSAAEPLTLVRAVEMPGVKGRIDHLTVDLSSGRLFVAALGNDTVEVIDGRAEPGYGG